MKKQHPLPNQPISTGLLILLFLFAFAALPVTAGAQIFVDADALGFNNGSSWFNAYNSLQDALDDAESGDEIWVAEGIYFPVTPDDSENVTNTERLATFQLISGVEIYGGFDGTESTLGARDVDAHPTILSGDIDGNDTTTDGVVTDTGDISGSNSFHVVTGSGTDGTALLDGFTVTAGLANTASGEIDAFAAGMLNENGSPALTDLTFSGNSARRSGGGMYNFDSDPTLTNVTFSDNRSGEEGGGMFNRISHPTLTNVTFIGNSADGEFGGDGGGMNNDDSSPTLTNVAFTGNSARIDGGGMYNVDDSHPTLTKVTFSGNSAGRGGGMFNVGDNHPTLTNVIFSGNSSGEEGGGMINGSNSNPTLTNVTFSGNSAGSDGGGMLNVGSDPTLTNVIIWDNEADGVTTSTSASIFNDSSTPVISHSLIANSEVSGSWNGDLGTDAGGNIIDADPLFTDSSDPDGPDDTFGTDDDGLHLANASPAINRGTNDPFGSGEPADGVTTDLAGNDRIRYTTVDMGAYEWEWNGGSTVFVDKNATGNNTGESWDDAFTSLQDGLATGRAANSDIDEVWVADGVYTPTDNTDERDATFQLSSGLAVYGGFAGGEPNREDRDWGANPTILSGDIGGDDTSINGVVTDPDNISGNNSYQVVIGSGTNNTAILDGFTITAGNADGSSPKDLGGGMYNNDGSPTLFNISIIGNSAAFGGGIFNENSSPNLVNFLITGNSSGTDGGAMVNFANSHSVLTNGTFTGNSADDEGGAIYNEGSDPTLTNVIIWDNQANGSTTSGAASISNVISDPAISHSLIANSGGSGSWNTDIGNDGEGNIDADPLFTDPTDPDGADDMFGTSDDGLALQDGSPAINMGTNDPFGSGGVAEGITTDLADNPRIFDSTVDMGAYENQSVSIQPDADNILYVDQNVSGGNQSGDSWTNAIPELRDALDWADENWDGDTDGTLQIWVADGLYTAVEPADVNNVTLAEREATFQLVSGVEVYGGFAGTESTLGERDVDANRTILSGDIDGNDDPFDPDTDSDGNPDTPSQTDHINGDNSGNGNSRHVVTGSGTDDTARIDGFTITGGWMDSTDIGANGGGGMINLGASGLGNPVLANLVFAGNHAALDGGGMDNSGDPTLTNVIFSGNSARSDGGGMRNLESSPTLTNVTFSGNSTDGDGGGMINSGNPTLTNVTFSDNSAGLGGGGMDNDSSSNPTLTNVTFSGNSARFGGGMINSGNPTLTNVTFSGNSAGSDGGGMINGGNPTLTNVTFSGNSAGSDGGAIFSVDSEPVLTNVIIWNNEAGGVMTSTSASIFNDSSTPDISHSLIANSGGSGTGWEDAIGTDGGDNIDTDPLFVDPTDPDGADDLFGTSDDGLALQDTSPAINTGDPDTDLSLFPGGPDAPLDLAGNPRVFDDDTDIIDIGAYEFQGEPFSPEADDGRVLASNLNGYTFEPVDFGQSDNGASVIIQTLAGNGDLELDGTGVAADDEIPVGDIDDGKLTYMPTGGGHGAEYDSFNFTVKESGIESDTFTMTIDVGAASVELTAAEGTSAKGTGTEGTGGEGWRFLGNPSGGDSYEDLLGPIWTKGVPGSDSPGALFPNIYTLDQPNYQWEAPSGLSHATEPGRPFIVYIYADDDNDGTPEGFPKTLTSGQNWLPLDGSFSYGGLGYDESEENPDSHFLIANPHPVSLDFCEFTSTNIANSVDIWDPSANGGNGDYVNLSCGVDDVFIAPFQGFWVRTTDTNPVLEIPESAYLESAEEGYFKQKEDLTGLTLTVQSEDNIFTNTARILFSEEASVGLDKWDAPKLSPAGLAERWLSFYSLDEEDKAYALQNLPTDFGEKISIPLDIQTTEPGRYTLNWNLPESNVLNGSYFLRDNRTGQVVELREGAEYRFEIEPAQTSKVSETLEVLGKERSAKFGEDFADLGGGTEPRFELLIAQAGVDGFTELGAVPEQFELAQNYPNPFNPTTVISYQLPVNSEVRLEVFDMLGRNVATLVSGQVEAGRHTVNFDASGLSSGVYLYRLAAGTTIMTKKLTVVK